MATYSQRIAVLGFGHVGRMLCRQAQRVGVKVVAVADSSGLLHSHNLQEGFTGKQLDFLTNHKAVGKSLSELGANESQNSIGSVIKLEDFVSILAKETQGGQHETAAEAQREDEHEDDNELNYERIGPLNPVVLADCSAAEHTTVPLVKASAQGLPVVLANKKPLSGDIAFFEQLRSHSRLFRHEATVGAGLPVICALDRQLLAGDSVHKIEGAFSGTLGFIFSGLQEGRKFSEIVREARIKGFTEPDPRDDLSGTDVARKALILARMLGSRAHLTDINIESLYPKHMSSLTVEEFMDRLEELDSNIAEKVKLAQTNGCQLRYAATVTDNGKSIKVGMVEASMDSNPLAGLRGTNNMVAIHSEYYQSPLIVQGPGAGVEVTAAGVLSDILSLRY